MDDNVAADKPKDVLAYRLRVSSRKLDWSVLKVFHRYLAVMAPIGVRISLESCTRETLIAVNRKLESLSNDIQILTLHLILCSGFSGYIILNFSSSFLVIFGFAVSIGVVMFLLSNRIYMWAMGVRILFLVEKAILDMDKFAGAPDGTEVFLD